MLSDWLLKKVLSNGRLVIFPKPTQASIQPASIDLRLGMSGLRWKPDLYPNFVIDPSVDNSIYKESVDIKSKESGGYIIPPYGFLLAELEEYIALTEHLAAFLHGKSSIGRLGLFIHVTAGLIDPGWRGRPTLELFNAAPYALRVWSGLLIGQLTVEELSTPAKVPYGHPSRSNRYQGDLTVAPSRSHLPTKGE